MFKSKSMIFLLLVTIVVVVTIVSFSVDVFGEDFGNDASIICLFDCGISTGEIGGANSISLFSSFSFGYSLKDSTITILCFLRGGYSKLIVRDNRAITYPVRVGGKVIINRKIGVVLAEEWISLLNNKIYYPVFSLSLLDMVDNNVLNAEFLIDYYPALKGFSIGLVASYRFNL